MSRLPFPIGRVLREAADDARLAEVWQRIGAGRRRPRRSRVGVAAGALVAACLALWIAHGQWQRRAPLERADHRPFGVMQATAATGALRIAASDGSVMVLAPGTRLEPVQNRGGTFRVALRGGRAEFDVRPGGPRRWIVDGGVATVEVLGTHFVVERGAAGVRVSVSRGHVLVRSPRLSGGARELRAGEAVAVAADPPPVDPSPPTPATGPPAVAGSAPVAGPAPAPAGGPASAAGPAPIDLLAEADRARRAGRLDAALALLERASRAPGDRQRAALAAFTLGRLLLDARGDAAGAADAFRRALALGLPDALVDDGYLRAHEALARAGQRSRARALAAAYCARFPHGTAAASLCPVRAPPHYD